MNSTYVTFGEFNPEPPPPPPRPSSEGYGMGSSYDPNGPSDGPPRPGRYPIRQHMTQPRNPYTPQMLPPYPRHDTPATFYNNSPSAMMMPMMPQGPPPPPQGPPRPMQQPSQLSFGSTTPPSPFEFDMSSSNTTPIGKAFSEDFEMSSSLDEPSKPPSRMARLLDATCVDINDHIVNCPICSKYYQNHTTVYVGIIILLGFIILIFLLKSIMEVKR